MLTNTFITQTAFGCCFFIYFSSLLSFALKGGDDVVFPLKQDQDELATRINCRIDESRHFKYSSITELWSDIDGQISLEADVILHCLGDDKDGLYGAQALKYVAEISNLAIQESHRNFEELHDRRKRGIGDFFSNAWRKVKNFFTRLFGGTVEEEQSKTPTTVFEDRSITDPTTTSTPELELEDEEEEENFNSLKHKEVYSSPFEFIQLANGSIPEIRFSENDSNSKVRNFKRHLVDAFATQLSVKPQHEVVVETSVMGEHLSTYNITLGAFASAFTSPDYEDDEEGQYALDEDSRTVVVEKLVTEEDILNLAPSPGENAAINDKNKIDLKARQTQIFKGGKLLSTSGSSSLVLFPKAIKRKTKRDVEADGEEKNVMSYFQAHSTYQIEFTKRQKRSLSNNYLQARLDDSSSFSAASRAAESEDNSAIEKLRQLQLSIGNTTRFAHHLIKNIGGYEYEQLQSLFEMVEQEIRYKLDQESQSLSVAIRNTFTEEAVDDVCTKSFKNCIDFLQLLARAGGPKAEKVILSFIPKDTLTIRQRQEIVDVLSDVPNPSLQIFKDLNNLLLGGHLDPPLLGSVSLSASNIAAKAGEEQKQILAKTLAEILEASWSTAGETTDPLTLDVLEAIGNIGHKSSINQVLQISAEGQNKIDVQIACAHALRHMASVPSVQQWMLKMVSAGSCDISHAIIGSLLDEIYNQEMAGDEKNWPRIGYNDVDTVIRDQLSSSAPEFECAAADAARYFRRKKSSGDDEADTFFEMDSEPFEPGMKSRQKRGLFNDLSCSEWVEDNKYTPIQDKDEFASDRVTYNKRKSCLATRKLGLPGAKTDIYAGMFAGVKEPSDPPKYKLFTKFVSGVSFLGNEMEIGSFYFYHHSGYTKAYVRIMGKTRQEFRHDGCTPTELKYRPITHIPLYEVRIAVLQFSLGIHLSSELALNTLCPTEQSYDMKPLAHVRAGGEAMGTVLFARGGINLGGNFNYHLRFSFSPVPDMCLTGQHGYDPMSVSIEAYYQLWNFGKIRWGKPRTWKPSSLMWEVTNAKQQPWFNDTCILRTEEVTTSSVPPPSTVADPIAPPPDDDNVLVVRAE